MTEPFDPIAAGRASYERWRDGLRDDPDYQELYNEEGARGELWLQLVEARLDAGVTQEEVGARLGVSKARVARIERRGYQDCSLHTLRRYLHALGDGFDLAVSVRRPAEVDEAVLVGAS